MSSRRNRKSVKSPAWEKTTQGIDPAVKRQMELSFDIVDQIHTYLNEKNWTQLQLAEVLDKQPSEISKWLSPGHNMTLKTLAKIEVAIRSPIMITPLRHEARQQAKIFGSSLEHDHYRALLLATKMRYDAIPSVSSKQSLQRRPQLALSVSEESLSSYHQAA
jgi:transcriptional regulator with XRE-family HTH domain